jgi:hypothetical protein
MPGKSKAQREKRRIEIKVDGYDELDLKTLMDTDLWVYEQDAIKAAIRHLADEVRSGKFSPEGRKITLK